MALTARQAAFVREYLVDRNGTQAAIRAGYKKETARFQGSRLLVHPEIAAAVRQGEKAIAEKLDISAERIETELARIAFGDATQLFTEDGIPLKPSQIPASLRPLFAGYEIDPATETRGERHTLKVRSTTDQLKAIEMLSRRHPAFRTSTDLNITGIAAMTPAQKAERLAALVEKGRARR